jgi:hypothetical protein
VKDDEKRRKNGGDRTARDGQGIKCQVAGGLQRIAGSLALAPPSAWSSHGALGTDDHAEMSRSDYLHRGASGIKGAEKPRRRRALLQGKEDDRLASGFTLRCVKGALAGSPAARPLTHLLHGEPVQSG